MKAGGEPIAWMTAYTYSKNNLAEIRISSFRLGEKSGMRKFIKRCAKQWKLGGRWISFKLTGRKCLKSIIRFKTKLFACYEIIFMKKRYHLYIKLRYNYYPEKSFVWFFRVIFIDI